MKKESKFTAWITAGIFSNHYLLERLPQIVYKVHGLTDQEIKIVKIILSENLRKY